jgi:hypothetical protein
LGLMLSKDDTQHPSQTCAPYFLQLPKLPVTLQGLKFNTSKFEIDRGFSGRASVSARGIHWLSERLYDVNRAPNIIGPKKSRTAADLLLACGSQATTIRLETGLC